MVVVVVWLLFFGGGCCLVVVVCFLHKCRLVIFDRLSNNLSLRKGVPQVQRWLLTPPT